MTREWEPTWEAPVKRNRQGGNCPAPNKGSSRTGSAKDSVLLSLIPDNENTYRITSISKSRSVGVQSQQTDPFRCSTK